LQNISSIITIAVAPAVLLRLLPRLATRVAAASKSEAAGERLFF